MKPDEEVAEAIRQLNKRLRKIESALELMEQRIESTTAMNKASEGKITRNTKEIIELKDKVRALTSNRKQGAEADLEHSLSQKNF